MNKKTYTIFYSWQSSVGKQDNRFYIRNKIDSVVKSQVDYDLILDEATRDKAGSPEIVSSIMGKIGIADIFVCDLTITNKYDKTNEGGMPNPNVMFELGVAVSNIGWERIICVVNTYYGEIKLLPFDINHHRCLQYSKNGKEVKKELDLAEPILKIICNYDDIVDRFRKNDHILHDQKLFEKLTENYSEESLVNTINNCKLSRIYNNSDFIIWNSYLCFQNYPKNRFIMDDLNATFNLFIIALDGMITEFTTLFNPVDFGWEYEDPDLEYTEEELERILRTQRYRMREPEYPQYDTDEKLRKYYKTIDDNIAKINYHCNNVLNCFTTFRDAVSRLLFV